MRLAQNTRSWLIVGRPEIALAESEQSGRSVDGLIRSTVLFAVGSNRRWMTK